MLAVILKEFSQFKLSVRAGLNWLKTETAAAQSSQRIGKKYMWKKYVMNGVINTPGTRVGPGSRNRTLAVKSRKSTHRQLQKR